MHPSLLSLVVAFGALDHAPQAEVTSTIHFEPVHDGFLLVREPTTDAIHYSRGGTFHLDGYGRLLDANAMALVTLKQHDAPGEVSWQDLRVPSTDLQTPRASERLAWRGNLDPYAPPLRFNPAHPEVTSNHASFATVYDTQGGRHNIAIYFSATGIVDEYITYHWTAMADPNDLQDPNAWRVSDPNATDANAVNANAVNANKQGIPRDAFGRIGQGGFGFNRNGTLAGVKKANAQVTVHFAGLPEPQTIKLDFGNPVDVRHNGRDGLTAFSQAPVAPRVTQDGYPYRWVKAISELDVNGLLVATLSDGVSLPLDPLVMARFYNLHGLSHLSGDIFAATNESGPPNLTVATCADMRATMLIDDPATGLRSEAAVGTCPFLPQSWQRLRAAPKTYFALEGEHAGHAGTYLAREIDLRLIAGAPLQEAREGLRLQAVVPMPGGQEGAVPADGGLLIPPPADLLAPKMTTTIVLTGNLDASNPPRTMDPYDLKSSANASIEIAVYDHTGRPHPLRFDFYAQAKQDIDTVLHHRYLWLATLDAPTDNNGARELDNSAADGIVVFNPNGAIHSRRTVEFDLPLGPNGAMVSQTVYFGEPPDAPHVEDPNLTPAPLKTSENANTVADSNTQEAAHDPNTVILLPAPLTSLARATRLVDTYQDGWQPGVGDMQYGIDICGVLSVGLPTGERLMLGTIVVVEESDPQAPLLLNDWLYAWPGFSGPPTTRPATCGDVVFDDGEDHPPVPQAAAFIRAARP